MCSSVFIHSYYHGNQQNDKKGRLYFSHIFYLILQKILEKLLIKHVITFMK